MAKAPAFQFYPGDWLKDPQLSLCAPATRGVWIDLISAMHESNQSGELCGTVEQLARIARCSTVELDQALTDLQTTGAADVTKRHTNVTVVNRRMQRKYRERLEARHRKQKQRGHGPSPPSVTIPSSSSTSVPPIPQRGGVVNDGENARTPRQRRSRNERSNPQSVIHDF